jgi:ubiquinone biosynthesis accessory factor UbiJ
MLNNLQGLLVPAVVERLVLVVNHVLSSEPAAMARLVPHGGRVVALELAQWPKLLPSAPEMRFRITPPGLLEWCGLSGLPSADLTIRVDAQNPALLFVQALAGEPPRLEIAGDAALATDMQWLVDNLRWDIEADLDRLFGPIVARQVGRLGSSLARGFRAMARGPLARQGQSSAATGAEHRAP